MSAFIIILFYFIVLGEIIWWFTSVRHTEIPLLLEIVIAIIMLCPGLHIIGSIVFAAACWMACIEGDIQLKNNWFNRKFLAHRE